MGCDQVVYWKRKLVTSCLTKKGSNKCYLLRCVSIVWSKMGQPKMTEWFLWWAMRFAWRWLVLLVFPGTIPTYNLSIIHLFNGNVRILTWRNCTIFEAIVCWDIPWKLGLRSYMSGHWTYNPFTNWSYMSNIMAIYNGSNSSRSGPNYHQLSLHLL